MKIFILLIFVCVCLLLSCSSINNEQHLPDGFDLVQVKDCYIVKNSYSNTNYINSIWLSKEGAIAYANWYNTTWHINKIQ